MNGMHLENAIDPGLVRAKAYEIWQSLGCPEGAADQTWLEAERQLLSRQVKSADANQASAPRVVAEARPAFAAASESEPPPAPRSNVISAPPMSKTSEVKPQKSTSNPRRATRR